MKIIHLLILLTVSIFPLKAESFKSAVRVKALIPESARTASFLGQKREGTEMMIDDEGRILTIGYIVLEAKSVKLPISIVVSLWHLLKFMMKTANLDSSRHCRQSGPNF